jgi:hypothetical protein
MPRVRFWSVLAISAALPVAAAAQSDGPVPDLAALIECRADVQAWGALAFPLMEGPATVEALGWRERASENPFLKEFDLPAAVGVFGRSTERIAVTATGPMAVLDGVTPEELAAELGIAPTVSTPGKFLGEKVVFEKSEEADGIRFQTRITLNVSNVDTDPGLTLAGCSYVVETSEAQ